MSEGAEPILQVCEPLSRNPEHRLLGRSGKGQAGVKTKRVPAVPGARFLELSKTDDAVDQRPGGSTGSREPHALIGLRKRPDRAPAIRQVKTDLDPRQEVVPGRQQEEVAARQETSTTVEVPETLAAARLHGFIHPGPGLNLVLIGEEAAVIRVDDVLREPPALRSHGRIVLPGDLQAHAFRGFGLEVMDTQDPVRHHLLDAPAPLRRSRDGALHRDQTAFRLRHVDVAPENRCSAAIGDHDERGQTGTAAEPFRRGPPNHASQPGR